MLFQKVKNKKNCGSQRIVIRCVLCFVDNYNELKEFIRPAHANPRRIRKGAATKASADTTCPPQLTSIARGREWSMGMILDMYFQFAEAGDAYLGRCLTGLDPISTEFQSLPPHWQDENAFGLEAHKQAIQVMFGRILKKWTDHVDPASVFSLCLASVVYYRDFIRLVGESVPGHPYNAIPLFQHPDLVDELAEHVTIKPSAQMERATGIPSHINLMEVVIKVLTQVEQTHKDMGELSDEIKTSMEELLESRAVERGEVTPQRMIDNMKGHYSGMKDLLDNRLKAIKDQMSDLRVARQGLQNDENQMALEFNNDILDDPEEVIPEQDTEAERAKYQRYATMASSGTLRRIFSFQLESSCVVAGNCGWLACLATQLRERPLLFVPSDFLM
mmetsp:Transcript_12435/g.19147  ORF Transcript_12435/g.19147 Transcript_12435/m.19147 type:complete len:389 (+) Transcript_12435:979-2145(+)